MCQEWKMPTVYILYREAVESKGKLNHELLKTDVEKRNYEMNTECKQMLCFLELGIELGNYRGRWEMLLQDFCGPFVQACMSQDLSDVLRYLWEPEVEQHTEKQFKFPQLCNLAVWQENYNSLKELASLFSHLRDADFSTNVIGLEMLKVETRVFLIKNGGFWCTFIMISPCCSDADTGQQGAALRLSGNLHLWKKITALWQAYVWFSLLVFSYPATGWALTAFLKSNLAHQCCFSRPCWRKLLRI